MIRENWRVVALVALLVLSGVFLFVPGVGLGNQSAEQGESRLTNLQYGLDLDSGARIEAPLVGWTATGVDVNFEERSPSDVEVAVAEGLEDTGAGDVRVRFPTQTRSDPAIEVTSNVTREAFANALDAADVSYGGIRGGVTEETRTETVRVLNSKVDEAGLGGARVQSAYSQGDDRWFVRVEVPGQNRSQVMDLVSARGQVQVLAHYPDEDGEFTNRTVLRRQDFQEIGIAQRSERVGEHVPVVVHSEDVDGDGVPQHEEFQRDVVETGVADRSGRCDWPDVETPCLLTVVDGEVVYSAGMAPDLGQSMIDGTWVNDPSFVLQTGNMSEARALSLHLRAGALPADLDLDNANFQYVSPGLGERFRLSSLLTGIITVFAVAITVFVRYRDPRVAAPMVVTALSEVVILLGFAASVGMALDLSHIAGLIAVIGTGVDDLIIIADEVMGEGSVSSHRVFQSRFRKAFWVIGVAAATTIIAMSPLAILSLGDLRGFAIVTILGVLVGVLITRPAYGDILRSWLTDN